MWLQIKAAQAKWEKRALAVQATADATVIHQLSGLSGAAAAAAAVDITAYLTHANDMLDGKHNCAIHINL